ncbi:MAG: TIGR02117 family protein [Candidatus Sedimenticola sp. (ex Thyasira tokunagai)]
MSDTIKKLLLLLFKTGLLLVLLLIGYLLAALISYGLSSLEGQSVIEAEASVPIYLFADDFHADLMIPIDAMDPAWDYLFANGDLSVPRREIKLLSIGWGSREFYLNMREWDQLTLDLSLKALAFDATVMHITAYRSDVVKLDHPMVSRRHINLDGYGKLMQFIRQGFAMDSYQRAIHIPGMGYGVNDSFFEGTGNYNLIRTCNQWTGEALRQAGISAPRWAPFSHTLRWTLQSSDVEVETHH